MVCYNAVIFIKHRINIDDSLDVFAVHGVGGILGTLMVAIVGLPILGGIGSSENWLSQLQTQAIGVLAVAIWSLVVSLLMVWFIRKILGSWTVRKSEELEGLDTVSHGERGYDLK